MCCRYLSDFLSLVSVAVINPLANLGKNSLFQFTSYSVSLGEAHRLGCSWVPSSPVLADTVYHHTFPPPRALHLCSLSFPSALTSFWSKKRPAEQPLIIVTFPRLGFWLKQGWFTWALITVRGWLNSWCFFSSISGIGRRKLRLAHVCSLGGSRSLGDLSNEAL